MKTLLFGLLCTTVLLWGCVSKEDAINHWVKSYCKWAWFDWWLITEECKEEWMQWECINDRYIFYCYDNTIKWSVNIK